MVTESEGHYCCQNKGTMNQRLIEKQRESSSLLVMNVSIPSALFKKNPIRAGLDSQLFMLGPVSCALQITGNNFILESHI